MENQIADLVKGDISKQKHDFYLVLILTFLFINFALAQLFYPTS